MFQGKINTSVDLQNLVSLEPKLEPVNLVKFSMFFVTCITTYFSILILRQLHLRMYYLYAVITNNNITLFCLSINQFRKPSMAALERLAKSSHLSSRNKPDSFSSSKNFIDSLISQLFCLTNICLNRHVLANDQCGNKFKPHF